MTGVSALELARRLDNMRAAGHDVLGALRSAANDGAIGYDDAAEIGTVLGIIDADTASYLYWLGELDRAVTERYGVGVRDIPELAFGAYGNPRYSYTSGVSVADTVSAIGVVIGARS